MIVFDIIDGDQDPIDKIKLPIESSNYVTIYYGRQMRPRVILETKSETESFFSIATLP